jgi:RNA polymerase sigma-70 factor (ECF subfamily)
MQARRDGRLGRDSAAMGGRAEPLIHCGPTTEVNVLAPQLFDSSAEWLAIVEQIRRGDNAGMEKLYRVFEKGVRFYFLRQLGIQEVDDKVHETFLIVVHAIRNGDLRDAERLMGFVRTVVRRLCAAGVNQIIQNRREGQELGTLAPIADQQRNPEQRIAFDETVELMLGVLNELSLRDRDILTRYYLHEETQEQICEAMKLTHNQFRLLKSRAKARLGGLGKQRLRKSLFARYFGRTSPSSFH